jgi:hypothetical protein
MTGFMAVLIEGLSVVIRNCALDKKFPGGSLRFQQGLRDDPICFDNDLTCMHLKSPEEVGGFIGWCESNGLIFLVNAMAVELVVVDQRTGPTTDCEWIQYSHVPFNDTPSHGQIAVCWLGDGRNQLGAQMAVTSLEFMVSMPMGWQFNGSLSERHHFSPVR